MTSPQPQALRRRPLLAAALIALGAPLALATGPMAAPLFPDMAYTVGGDPAAVAIGDLDGDGRRDLIIANRWTEDLSVLPGRGDGDFAPERRVPVAGIPVALAVADFNRDGRDDVAVVLPVDDRVGVFLTLGGGTPGPQGTLTAGDSPSALLAADLTGDGVADLAVTDYFSDDVLLFAGVGDGTFSAPRAFAAGRHPAALVAGLFDGDRFADLAVANEGSGDLTILAGDGSGGFRRGVDVPTWARVDPGTSLRDVLAADFDGDGALDLVVGILDHSEEMNSVWLLPGRGDGTFAEGGLVARASDGDLALGAADFNRDGRPDLAFGAHHGLTCCNLRGGRILLGRGDLGFDAGGSYRSGIGPVALAAGFLDGDDVVDLAVISDVGWEEVAIDLGRGDGTMGREPVVVDRDADPEDVAPGDVDGDGRTDIVALEPWTGRLGVLRSLGGGRFEEPVWRAVGGHPADVAVGDFNGDGRADVAVSDAAADDISVYAAIGEGRFADAIRFHAGAPVYGLAAGDVTGDGIDDLLMAGSVGGEVILVAAPGLGSPSPRHLPAGCGNPRAVVAADPNGDGLPDIVVAGEALAVLVATAPGNFAAPLVAATDIEFPPRLLAGDLDRDGRADVAATRSGGLRFYFGSADGVLEPGGFIGMRAPEALALADVDADGALDLLALDGTSETSDLWILADVGAASPGPARRVLLGTESRLILPGDLDGDRRIDLLVAGGGPGILLVENQGPFPNRPPHAVPRAAATAECTGPEGALVRLDGRESTDPDSSPGTWDDLAGFAWYEDYGLSSERLVAQGAVVDAILPLGAHRLTLVVLDRAGAVGSDALWIDVVDTTAPTAAATASPGRIGPPNHALVPVRVDLGAADLCGPVSVILVSATSSDPDDAPGGGDGATAGDIQDATPGTADYDVRLRAERDGRGAGRVYTLTYRVTDAAGNAAVVTAEVVVPRGREGGPPADPPGPAGQAEARTSRGGPPLPPSSPAPRGRRR